MAAGDHRAPSDLGRWTVVLLWTALILALAHHVDHVLRVDHSGWPFREAVTPFTFSLLAEPMVLFALFGPRRWFWARFALLAAGTAFTLYAHTAVESPAMQFHMWAENRSLEPHGHALHNLPGVRSPGLGMAAVVLSMTLNGVAVLATLAMATDGLRRRLGPRA